eukprot:g3831.t1
MIRTVGDYTITWHYLDADTDFGFNQSRELMFHLQSMLQSEDVTVQHSITNRYISIAPSAVDNTKALRRIIRHFAAARYYGHTDDQHRESTKAVSFFQSNTNTSPSIDLISPDIPPAPTVLLDPEEKGDEVKNAGTSPQNGKSGKVVALQCDTLAAGSTKLADTRSGNPPHSPLSLLSTSASSSTTLEASRNSDNGNSTESKDESKPRYPFDFVFCIGDQRSDERSFQQILRMIRDVSWSERYTVTVGKKKSDCQFYVEDVDEAKRLLYRFTQETR